MFLCCRLSHRPQLNPFSQTHFVLQVWNRTSTPRTVLLFDVWHPGITLAERISIIEMFESMKR